MNRKRNHAERKSVYHFNLFYVIILVLIGFCFSAGTALAGNARVPKEPPVVLAHTPVSDATQVPINGVVSVVWDRPMHPETSFAVTGPQGFVPGVFLYDPDTFTVTFLPNEDLDPGTRYGVLVAGQVDINGVVQQGTYQWNFSTVTPTSVSVVSFNSTGNSLGQSWLWSSWPWLMVTISALSLIGYLLIWRRRQVTP